MFTVYIYHPRAHRSRRGYFIFPNNFLENAAKSSMRSFRSRGGKEKRGEMARTSCENHSTCVWDAPNIGWKCVEEEELDGMFRIVAGEKRKRERLRTTPFEYKIHGNRCRESKEAGSKRVTRKNWFFERESPLVSPINPYYALPVARTKFRGARIRWGKAHCRRRSVGS